MSSAIPKGTHYGGGTNDREFRAFDANTGEQLWHFRTNSGIIAPASTFEVNGVQYIAVQSGYGVDAAFQQGLMSEVVGAAKGRAARRRRLGIRRRQVTNALRRQ
jgi:alcohol dehydrogenase (cytochrome c)